MTLAALPLLLLPYDSLTYLLGFDAADTSQTFPATAVFSLAYLVLRGGRLKLSPAGVRVCSWLLAALGVIAIVTLVNILAEAAGWLRADVYVRNYVAVRQGLSLGLGFTSYLMFQDAITRLGLRSACRWIVVGALPSLGVCGVQILKGDYRIQGYSSEPSHLGDMLVLAFLPACAFAGLRLRRQFTLMFSGGAALMASFSGTAIMKAVFEMFSLFAVKGHVLRGLIIASIGLGAAYGVLLLYPDNYIFQLWGLFSVFLDEGTLVGGSFIDRFFGLVGPLNMMDRPAGWLGVGLGGDTIYFDQMFDPATADAIRSQKQSVPSISSHQGKMLLYGGVAGLALYLSAWVAAWRAAPRLHPARFMIPTVFAASMFSLGPFFLPYVWLWLAFGASASALREHNADVVTKTPGLREAL